MSESDCTQHTRYTLIKSTSGKNVGLAFILRGVDVKSEDLFTVGEDLGGDHATDLPVEEIEADLPHIFVEDSGSTASRVTDSSKQASLNPNLHQNASASAMVSSLAEEMLQELGGGRKEDLKLEPQVYQEREQNKQREDLLACGLVEGKEELDKPGKLFLPMMIFFASGVACISSTLSTVGTCISYRVPLMLSPPNQTRSLR